MIVEHIKNGGSLNDSKKDIPYYSKLVYLIKKDRLAGINSTIESIYRECGYEYISRKQEITLERIKKEIDDFVKNGGNIQDKKENIPYYDLISSFIIKYPEQKWTYKKIYEACGYEYNEKMEAVTIERLKREIDLYVANGGDIYGDRDSKPYYSLLNRVLNKYKKAGINYTYEDIMRLCGYDYLNQKRNNYKLMNLFESIKDENGYIDSLKSTAEGKRVLYSIQERAKNKRLSVNDYLMVTFGVRFSNALTDVDYVSLVESDLLAYEKKYGYNNVNHRHIKYNDTKLLYRLEHLARYFPNGSVTSSEVLNFFGYQSKAKDKKDIDEEMVIETLYKLFPDRDVSGITGFRRLYDQVVKLSVQHDMTEERYLRSKGFSKKNSNQAYRLSKVKQENNDVLYEEICVLREELFKKSDVMNNYDSTQSDISEEIELIADKVIKSVMNKKNRLKR